MWDNWETTDDHGMHAVGIARDEKGEIYYLVKNSWGVDNQGPHAGHIYMHENYLRGKMESIMMHKDGLPKDLREKLGL
jgi:bleomycin hydrolase